MERMLEPLERILQELMREAAEALVRMTIQMMAELLEAGLQELKTLVNDLLRVITVEPTTEREGALH